MNITLDRQVVSDRCDSCDSDFAVVRGSAFDDGIPFGIYLIALHGHSPWGPVAHIAVGLQEGSGNERRLIAAALLLFATDDDFCFSIIDWEDSPWKGEAYLGTMLGRSDVQAHTMKDIFLHVADHVAADLPEVQRYFLRPG